MLDYREIAEAYAYGLIPGYSIYEIVESGDLPSSEEWIGGLSAIITHAWIGTRLQRTGLLARAGLVLTTGGETLAEFRMLFPRTFAIAGAAASVVAIVETYDFVMERETDYVKSVVESESLTNVEKSIQLGTGTNVPYW